ncbi:MAG: mycofactocin biosynthesis peptidyl-dipeptidase MftE [Antricoccus sp.]
MSSPEVGAAAATGAALIVPIGSTEQHGAHLPLTVDTTIAQFCAQTLTRARPAQTVLAPTLPYGASGEHAAFPGTLSIGQAALEIVVVELGRSATDTFSKVFIICGHGGNFETLRRALRTLRDESRNVGLWMCNSGGDAHAGHSETSIMRQIQPNHVQMSRAQLGNIRPVAELMPAMIAGGLSAVSANGVLGDPTGATAQVGAQLLAKMTTRMISAFDDWYA